MDTLQIERFAERSHHVGVAAQDTGDMHRAESHMLILRVQIVTYVHQFLQEQLHRLKALLRRSNGISIRALLPSGDDGFPREIHHTHGARESMVTSNDERSLPAKIRD